MEATIADMTRGFISFAGATRGLRAVRAIAAVLVEGAANAEPRVVAVAVGPEGGTAGLVAAEGRAADGAKRVSWGHLSHGAKGTRVPDQVDFRRSFSFTSSIAVCRAGGSSL